MSLRELMINKAFGKGKEGLRNLALEWTRRMWSEKLWMNNRWLGMEIWQWPTDLLVMQELIFEQRPKIILETGTAKGGSSIFYASILKLLDGGRVISVDIDHSDELKRAMSEHPFGSMVTLITGDSQSDEIIDKVRDDIGGEKSVLVTLDSHHGYEHVLSELKKYREFVPVGGYLVAMDTICKELSVIPGNEAWREDNPLRAVETFLERTDDFEVDYSRDKLLVGFSPGGFLRRVK